jgi:hypothetical protein
MIIWSPKWSKYDCNHVQVLHWGVATLFWKSERMTPSFPKWGLGSSLGLLKLQNLIARAKTPCIEAFFIPLENYLSLDIENGLVWVIWTSVTRVMTKRKSGSQTGNLTSNHQKSRIDPTLVCAGEVQHTIWKLSTRATTLLETLLQSEVCTWSYVFSKWQES